MLCLDAALNHFANERARKLKTIAASKPRERQPKEVALQGCLSACGICVFVFGVHGTLAHVRHAVATAVTATARRKRNAKQQNDRTSIKFYFRYISTGIVLYLSALCHWYFGSAGGLCVVRFVFTEIDMSAYRVPRFQ